MGSKAYFLSLAVTANLFFSISILKAQDSTKVLNLGEAIATALNNNRDIRIAKLDENISVANYKQTEAVFLPQVGFSYTLMTTNDPLNAFGFKLEQQTISQNDFNPVLLNHPASTPDIATKLEIQQPLLNMDMLYAREGAKKQTEVYQYKTQRRKEYLSFEVQNAWLQLQLGYDAADVLEDALRTAKSVFEFTDNHFKQGLIQKSDLLNAQVHLTTIESELQKSRSSIRNASDYLSLLMGQKTGTIYKIGNAFQEEKTDIDTIQKMASSRADFMAIQKAIEATGLMIKSSQLSYVPKLNAFGNYQYNDSHLTGFGANSYFAGVRLSWDIFKGNLTKNKIVTQKLERDKLAEQLAQQKDEAQMEISKAFRDLSDARFEMAREKVAVEQALESFRILKNRYQQGLINTTDILTAETQLSQQKFALAQVSFKQRITEAYLQLLTSSTDK